MLRKIFCKLQFHLFILFFPIFVNAQFFSLMENHPCESGESCFQQQRDALTQTMCRKMQEKMGEEGNPLGYPTFSIPRIRIQKNKESDFVVLNIHGLYGDANQFRRISDQLNEKGISTINVVLPGHGFDSEHANQVNYHQWSEEAQAALKFASRIGKKVLVMGQSTGALLAYELGQKYPDLIDSVIFVEPAFQVRPLIALSACSVGRLVHSAQQLKGLASIFGLGYLTTKDHSVRMGCQVVQLGKEIASSFQSKSEGSICGIGCDGPEEKEPLIQDTFYRWKLPSLMISNPQDQIVDPSVAKDLVKKKSSLFQEDVIPEGYSHGSFLPEETILKFIQSRTGLSSKEELMDPRALIARLNLIPKVDGRENPEMLTYLMNYFPGNFNVSPSKKKIAELDVLSQIERHKYEEACKFSGSECAGMLKSYVEISQDIFQQLQNAKNDQDGFKALYQIIASPKYKEYSEAVNTFERNLEEKIASKKLPYFDPLLEFDCRKFYSPMKMAQGK